MARVQLAWPPFSPRTMAMVGALPSGTWTDFFQGSATPFSTVALPDSLLARYETSAVPVPVTS
nr:hypothetical protein OG781_18070 [Streptomyces sp. NBC_00830]